MAIEWYSEDAAETEFADTLTQWATMYGYKGCFTADETQKEIAATKTWAECSPTARKLMHFVERSPKKIIVVGMRGGYQCFDSTAGRNKDLPVIFIDLGGKLTVNVRTPHNIHLDPNDCTGSVAPLDNRLALLHEFGHARQWLERPTQFDNKAPKKGFAGPKWGGGRLDKGAGSFDARLEKKTFATGIRDKAMEIRARSLRSRVEQNLAKSGHPEFTPDIFPSTEQLEEFVPPAWGPAIEMDNMARHEWPICRELGLPLRANYRDINCTSDAAPSISSVIRRKAEEIVAKEKAAAEAKKREEERIARARTAKVACTHPGCTQSFTSALQLKTHLNTHI